MFTIFFAFMSKHTGLHFNISKGFRKKKGLFYLTWRSCSRGPAAWGNLGNVLKNQGKMAEAERAYRKALHHRGNMADMLYNL